MKKISLSHYLAGFVILFLTGLSSCTCNQQSPEQKDPANYIYYLGQSSGASLGNAKEAAGTLLGSQNLPGEFIRNTGDGNVHYKDSNDPTVQFQQDPKSGNFSFSNSLKNYMGDYKPALPTVTDAADIALDYLKKYNLLPASQNQLRVTHVGGVKGAAVINATKRGEEIDKIRTVVFTRVIDSTPVTGAGSKIVVQLGDHKSLLGMAYRWKNINKDKPKKFVPVSSQINVEEAQKEVQQRVISEFGKDANYQVISNKKVLYDGDGNIMQPVYAFEVAINAKIGKEREGRYQYLYLIQALKDSPEPITISNTPPEAMRHIDTVNINESRRRFIDTTGKD